MKMRALMISAVVAASVCMPAAASDFLTISYPNDDSVLIISGNSGEKENLSIRVLALGEDGEEFIKEGDLKLDITPDDVRDNPGMLDYFYVTQSGEDGNYTFKYKTGGTSGYYLFTVTGADGYQETAAFEYYSPDYAKEKINLLNTYINNNETENINSFLKRYAEPLAVDNKYFTELKNESCFSEFASLIAAGGEVKGKPDLKDRIKAATARIAVKNSVFSEEKTLEMLNSEFELEKNALFAETLKKTVTNEVRTQILSDFADIDAISVDEFKKQLDDKIFLGAVNYSAWGKTMAVIDENISRFDDTIQSKYSALSDTKKANTAKIISEKAKQSPYTSFDALKTDLNYAIAQQTSGNAGGGSGGGSSGGSSSGGSGSGNKTSSIPATGNISGNISSNKQVFNDLDSAEWAREAVEALAEKGIVSGKSENEFAPGDFVTREEFLAMIVRAFGLSDDNAKCDFKDVSSDAWYYKTVASAYSAGITSGISSEMFGIGSPITRQDMCVLAYKAASKAGVAIAGGELNFADSEEISDYAKECVGAMSSAGILSGVGDNRFAPQDTATRAGAARVIYELLKLK